MSEIQVPVIKTIPTPALFIKAVLTDWPDVTSLQDPPEKRAVAILYAQFMMETGGLNCYGWNLGNVKHVSGDGYNYQCFRGVWEAVSPAHAAQLIAKGEASADTNPSHQSACRPNVSVLFNPPHPATRFRVYTSLADGMKNHLIMFFEGRYRSAWPAIMKGDVPRFAQSLRAAGYMTASAASYAHGMTAPFAHFMASLEYEHALFAHDPESLPCYPSDSLIIHPSVEFDPVTYDLG